MTLCCTGFKRAFLESSGGAFKANGAIYLAGACGTRVAARAIDLDGDGAADGIDLNGDGIADVRYIPIIPNQLVGLDINGDGKSDYYLNVGLNDEIKIYTQPSGGNQVTLTADATGQVTGFDLTGDCVANNTIINDIRNDAIAPTSSANSSGGAFNGVQTVTLTCTDNIACNGIAFTLNGSTPDFNGNGGVLVGASGTVTITQSGVLHWLARDANGNLEASVHKLSFQILGPNVALPPTYSPTVGYHSTPQNVALTTATGGATICYTTNVTTPTCTAAGSCAVGSAYGATIPVTTAAIIQAVSCKNGLSTSPMVTLAYAIDSLAPANASSFSATPGDGQVSFTWVNPADSDLAGIRILRKTGGYPANSSDGTVVFSGTGTSYTDGTVANGTQYYYTAFAYDGATNYATGVQATATPSGGIVNPPAFSPAAATYGVAQNVTISSITPAATICYSTSGVPSCSAGPTCVSSTAYVSAVNIPGTATLRAIACKTGYVDSGVTSGVYTIDTTPPGNVSPFSGTSGNTQINLSWTNPGDVDLAGIKILRKTGSYPANDTDGTVVYNSTGTAIVDSGLTNGTQYYYTAFSYDTIGNYASGTQATAIPATGPASAPTYSPVAGLYNATQMVTISSTTGSAIICYSTAGAPSCSAGPVCSSGTLYSSAVSIASTSTLQSIACASGLADSSVTSGVFTIDTTAPNNPTVPLYTAGNTQVTLGWRNSSSADSAGVQIVRATGGTAPATCTLGTTICTGAGCNANLTASATLRTFVDTGLTNGTQYSYRICAIDNATNLSAGITGSATPNNDAADVAADKAALAMGYNGGDSATNVRNNLTLSSSGGNGSSITWASNNTTYISNAGVVTRPAFGVGDQSVTMTATITKGTANDTKAFILTVKALTTCTVYTSGWFKENCNGTVTDVTHGLTWKKCSEGQTYNSSTGRCNGALGNFQYCGTPDNSCNGGTNTGTLTSGPAYNACNALNGSGGYAGITTWRVPTKTELKLIVYCSSGPSTPLADFVFCNGGSSEPLVHQEFFNDFPPGASDYHLSSTSSASALFWYLNDSQANNDGDKTGTGWKLLCTSD
jgi:hypothetical protein